MKRILARIALYIGLLLVVALSAGPLVWVALGSLKTNRELFSAASFFLPQSPRFDNYLQAVRIAPIGRFFMNSVVVCLGSTLLSVVLVSGCAYAVARFQFRFKGLIVALITSVLLLPAQSISQPIFVLYKAMDLFDTKTGLGLVYLAFSIPVVFYIMRSYFLSVPVSIEEAAKIDGAGVLRTYAQIAVPLAKPGMATAVIVQFLNVWNEFFFALVLTSSDRARTVPIALNYFTSQFSSNYPALFAAVVLTVLPTILLFVLAQEQVVENLAAGAVKA